MILYTDCNVILEPLFILWLGCILISLFDRFVSYLPFFSSQATEYMANNVWEHNCYFYHCFALPYFAALVSPTMRDPLLSTLNYWPSWPFFSNQRHVSKVLENMFLLQLFKIMKIWQFHFQVAGVDCSSSSSTTTPCI
jgi:hypothetical protein